MLTPTKILCSLWRCAQSGQSRDRSGPPADGADDDLTVIRGIGPTTQELAERLSNIPSKLTFSCGGCPQIFAELRDARIYKILVVGIEAHVCVQQTVLDLIADGFQVYLAVDAVGSRFDLDYQTALRRMDSAGATLTTTEAALFEWCDAAGTPEFKKISTLVREDAPANDGATS